MIAQVPEVVREVTFRAHDKQQSDMPRFRAAFIFTNQGAALSLVESKGGGGRFPNLGIET